MDYNEIVESFVLYLYAERQVSQETLKWYRKRLQYFIKWCVENDIDPLTKQAFRSFIADQREKGNPNATVAGYVRVFKHFGRWLRSEGILDHNPTETLRQPRVDDLSLKALDPEDAEKIIEAAKAPRNYAMVLVLRHTGARAKEVLSMRWSRIDWENHCALVEAKGGKLRVLYLSRQVVEALRAWKKIAPENEERVFPLKELNTTLKRLAKKAGVRRNFNPHAWRHAYGRDMSLNGCPTAVLQELMGHSTPVVTKKYARFHSDQLRSAYKRFAPWESEEEELPRDKIV